MRRDMKLHRLSLLIGALAGALTVGLVSMLGMGSSQVQAEDDLHLAVQKSQAMMVAYQLDNAGLHELDQQLNSGQFVPGALGKVRKARIAVQNTMWPTGLQDSANNLVGELMQLETALRDEDVAAGAPHATQSHDLAHDVADGTYTWLSTGQAPAATDHMH
jgi:hypothetical protein